MPVGRLPDGTWAYAPYASTLVVEDGTRVVCHACGDALTLISTQHLRRHGLTQETYRERFGLNRKASLAAPALAQKRRVEGVRRWEENDGVRQGLALGQEMARTGVLHDLGVAAQPAGSRRAQGRVPASREGAAPALRGARRTVSDAARARWTERAQTLGYNDLEAYLVACRERGVAPNRVRTELGCGGAVAARLVHQPSTLEA